MNSKSFISLIVYVLFMGQMLLNAQTFELKEGEVYFRSDAPLELIEARSDEMRGLIRIDKRRFAFSIPISTFEGFNSPLQRVHFNENYMESNEYPEATFSGRIIESIDMTKDGTYDVRAKGVLDIHGVEQERIIMGTLIIEEEGTVCEIKADFKVLLDEHDIRIPKIVNQKIAEEIYVEVNAIFTRP